MIRLLGAELRRLRSRRITLVSALVLVAVMGLFQLVVHSVASPPGPAEQAAGRQAYDEAVKSRQDFLVQCTAGGQTQQQCEADYPPPTLSDFTRTVTPFPEVGRLVTGAAAYLSMLVCFLVGASSIGAEYSSGSLANWLTFVPERLKVFGSKAAAVAIGSALVGAVAAFTLAGLAAVQVAFHDLPLTGTAAVAAASGRVVPLAVVAGLVGFGLALVTRHTVAALGFPLAYAIVAAVLLGLVYNTNGLAWLPPYLPDNNLAAFVQHGTSYTQYVTRVTGNGIEQAEVEKRISFAHSAVYWLVVAAVAVVVSGAVFRRRDVT